jgi:hypothetical protein
MTEKRRTVYIAPTAKARQTVRFSVRKLGKSPSVRRYGALYGALRFERRVRGGQKLDYAAPIASGGGADRVDQIGVNSDVAALAAALMVTFTCRANDAPLTAA